jgi:hypothetical protein
VRIVTAEGAELVGIPTAVDPDPDAHEAYLRPAEADDTEIAITLAGISSAELA